MCFVLLAVLRLCPSGILLRVVICFALPTTQMVSNCTRCSADYSPCPPNHFLRASYSYCCANQAWIAQILDESGTDANGDLIFSDDMLANGRVLCQVVNAIDSGAVGVIRKDDSDTSNVSPTY